MNVFKTAYLSDQEPISSSIVKKLETEELSNNVIIDQADGFRWVEIEAKCPKSLDVLEEFMEIDREELEDKGVEFLMIVIKD